MTNQELLKKYYEAFKSRNFLGMAECYHPEIEFDDPIFSLKGKKVSAMWHMLVSRGKDTEIRFSDISATEEIGKCHWEAKYFYGPRRRPVHNRVESLFRFKDGKIIRHQDSFDLWNWSQMALGLPGTLLGWSPWMRGRIQKLARITLEDFLKKHPEYS